MEPAHKTLTLTVKPNGLPKKKQHQHHSQIKVVAVYRECLKNHAASLGGHALDGCGEFMASPTSNPSDPTSLTCAACGCHRNFHRRLHRHRPISERQPNNNHDEVEEEEEEEEEKDGQEIHEEDEMDDDDEEKVDNSSAPHMLLALSAGGISPKPQAQPMQIHPVSVAAEESRQFQMKFGGGQENGSDRAVPNSRKRFRTKFSPQQKERMHELSERLGWRMHKRDEVLVEERCREIGIDKGVFKVWMHNNKHNFVQSQSSFRSSTTTTVTIPVTTASVENDNSNGNGNGTTVKVNGSGSDALKQNGIEN